MEIYILDSLLRRIEVVDKFESLIWTERYVEIGDFELVMKSTREARGQFLTGTRLAMNKSLRVMTVETVEDITDADGKEILKVKGRSLEALLEDRVAKDTLSNLSDEPKWILTGLPADIARTMFDDICRTGNLSPQDVIPFITPGTLYPVGTIPEPSTAITWIQEPDSLYNAMKNLCSLYDLGFRLVRNFDASQLYFDVYAGSNRTTKQTLFPPVIFAPNFDNLQNTTELTTIQNSKNVAYVFSEAGYAVVYPDGVDPDVVEGFDRHVLMVNAMEVTFDTLNIAGALEQAGKEALLASRSLSAFDGELAVAIIGDEFNHIKNLLDDKNPDFVYDDFSAWTEDIPNRITTPTGIDFSWVEPGVARFASNTSADFVYAGLLLNPVTPGVRYTWSHSLMADFGENDLHYIPVMNWYGSDGTTILRQDFPADMYSADQLIPRDDFKRFSISKIAPAGAVTVDVFICFSDADYGSSAFVKQIQLVQGSETQFQPKRPWKTEAYRYGIDYNLGDIVELRNVDGVLSDRRVSEQIFVSDAEGERSYPTLMSNDFIMAGTWLTAPINQVWADFVDEHWADM